METHQLLETVKGCDLITATLTASDLADLTGLAVLLLMFACFALAYWLGGKGVKRQQIAEGETWRQAQHDVTVYCWLRHGLLGHEAEAMLESKIK